MRNAAAAGALALTLLAPGAPAADPVSVQHAEGLVHGFLALSNLDGSQIASGDLIQNVRGDRVTTRLAFHFKDGSTHDETAVFTQRGRFTLQTDHLVQAGPAFEHPIDMTIDRPRRAVTVKYRDADGKQKDETEQMDLPLDLSNGMIITLLKNMGKTPLPSTLSYIAATPKPRLVHLDVSKAGPDSFTTAGTSREATHYVLKINIGGIAGAIAPIIGKQPPDSHVWVLDGEAPAFVKSEAALAIGGPVWRMELTSPAWPAAAGQRRER